MISPRFDAAAWFLRYYLLIHIHLCLFFNLARGKITKPQIESCFWIKMQWKAVSFSMRIKRLGPRIESLSKLSQSIIACALKSLRLACRRSRALPSSSRMVDSTSSTICLQRISQLSLLSRQWEWSVIRRSPSSLDQIHTF